MIRQEVERPSVKTPEQIADELESKYFQYEEIYEPPLPPLPRHEEFTLEELESASEALDDLLDWMALEDENLPIKKASFATEVKAPEPIKPKTEYAPPRVVEGRPEIAIIIDDVGMDRKHSFEVANMDAPLTLAFLPYAPDLKSVTDAAKAHGHELMIHMPMEAMDGKLSLGSIALREGMSKEEIDRNLDAAFGSFEGYVGLNNHMGSRLTQDGPIMLRVMERLKEKGLYFVDSKTIGSSVAAAAARAKGLRTGERDVFLDHVNTIENVRSSLRHLESVAERKGYAIAIGHPKAVTIQGLKEWIPDAEARGFKIVFASQLVSAPKGEVKDIADMKAEAPEVPKMPEQSVTISSDPIALEFNYDLSPPQSPVQPPE